MFLCSSRPPAPTPFHSRTCRRGASRLTSASTTIPSSLMFTMPPPATLWRVALKGTTARSLRTFTRPIFPRHHGQVSVLGSRSSACARVRSGLPLCMCTCAFWSPALLHVLYLNGVCTGVAYFFDLTGHQSDNRVGLQSKRVAIKNCLSYLILSPERTHVATTLC
jgi:hypothetical protein